MATAVLLRSFPAIDPHLTIDPDSAELHVLTWFRGVGDCGALASYAVTASG